MNNGMTLEGYSHTEHLEYQYFSEHKKNAFKTGAFAGTIEAAVLKKHSKNTRLMNDLEIED